MDKLIEKLRNGHKICMSGASPQCRQFSTSNNFIGKACWECHSLKAKAYGKAYSLKHKIKKDQIFGDLKLNKKEMKQINKICDDDDGDVFETESEKMPDELDA